jgi:hypothetical protein
MLTKPATTGSCAGLFIDNGGVAAHRTGQDRLVGLYTAAVARYSATVNDTTVTRGKTSKQEYDRLLSLSEEARISAEAARLALGRHAHKHGC